MVFSSISFLLYFLPIVLALYFIIPVRGWRNTVLLFASLFFYAWGEPIWVTLLLLSATVDYCCGRLIDCAGERPGLRRLGLILSVTINLGLLGVFKYQGFFLENINALFSLDLPIRSIALPIGISFYTFQTMSYTIDLYLGNTTVQRSFWDFLLYVSLFPQLVAGPIVRYADVADEIRDRRESFALFAAGVKRFIVGLAKKVILANTAGSIAELCLLSPEYNTTASAWMGVLFFFFQIYFDFSGYSDMAIGMGKMFGFHFKENFLYPLAADSIGEMWRRWHVSLTSFFRDYVYIPLGGNRRHHIRNLFIVWFLTGLWHGASWNFILWGFYYGAFVALERFFARRISVRPPALLRRLYFIVIATFGWVFFYYTDWDALRTAVFTLIGLRGTGLVDGNTVRFFLSNSVFFIICAAACFPFMRKWFDRSPFARVPYLEEIGYLLLFGVSFFLMVGQSYNPFLYFRF